MTGDEPVLCGESNADSYAWDDGFTSRAGLTPATVPYLRVALVPSRHASVAYLVRPGTEEPAVEIGWLTDALPSGFEEQARQAWLADIIAPMPKSRDRASWANLSGARLKALVRGLPMPAVPATRRSACASASPRT